ncbi:MAG TPA: response regulator transcription factor [Pyrinomonadaceae bacterium]|nr:response regulator transcription factor [Pyrinomonadaceae bacterium]
MSKDSAIKILIVDDHLLVRTGLRMLIESEPNLKVVGQASNRSEALALAKSEQPDLILLDIDLGSENGLDFLPELTDTVAGVHVLVLTGLREIESHRRAARLGAAGVVLKEHAADVLLKAIKKVHAGELWLDRSMMGSLLREMTQPPKIDAEAAKIATLTRREREVLTLVAEGLKNRDIAARLFISETTVTHHLSSVFAKLGVSDRLELVIYAFANNLAKTP